jgi:hypothetical protein
MVQDASEAHLNELVPVVFDRLEHLFPLPSFQLAISRVLLAGLRGAFRRCPALIETQAAVLINTLGHRRFAADGERQELLTVCWLIGEYTTAQHSPALLADFHGALELFLYEVMARSEPASAAAAVTHLSELTLVAVHSFAKVAVRCPDLTSRVILCLSKLLKLSGGMAPSVALSCAECIQVLRVPSLAPALLDNPLQANPTMLHVDQHSSLAFLLQPTVSPDIKVQVPLYQLSETSTAAL